MTLREPLVPQQKIQKLNPTLSHLTNGQNFVSHQCLNGAMSSLLAKFSLAVLLAKHRMEPLHVFIGSTCVSKLQIKGNFC